MPPFGFGDDQISIFAEIPDVVLPRKQASSFFFFFFFWPFSASSHPITLLYFPPNANARWFIFFLQKKSVRQATTLL